MNEPLLNKAHEIINKHSTRTVFGKVKFHSEDSALRALVDFAKFYDKYGHETEEEKEKDGNNKSVLRCAMCRETRQRCLCFDGFI